MNLRWCKVNWVGLCLGVVTASAVMVSGRVYAESPGEEMAAAANNFLNALTPEQRQKATYEFQDAERFDWHFIPKSRKGLPFKEMTAAQQRLAHALLSSGMSQKGFAKAETIMSLEEVLAGIEKGKGPTRDSDLYFFTIFGTPAVHAIAAESGSVNLAKKSGTIDAEAWGWRVEGHHLALNFVVRGDKVLSATPTFMGSNPAEVKEGPRKGLRLLGREEDLGRELVKCLNEEQRKVAVFSETAPKEIITGNSRKADPLKPEGLAAGKMTKAQREVLMNLVKEYAQRHRTEVAEDDLKKIEKAGWNKVYFAWAGGIEPGVGHYYRVQGPTFLMEYDDTQNNANHIHTVWRDFENDFGDDVLKQHYQEVKH
jgi:Protein of unknown function (DUF3500)